MAEIKQISYTNKEILILMIKDQNIHEGHWVLGAGFSFGAMSMGQSADGVDASPTAIATLSGLGIERVQEALPFSVDASLENPK
jgi:hypothetical protein